MEKVDPQRRRVVKIKCKKKNFQKQKMSSFYLHITLIFLICFKKKISLLKYHLLENNVVIISLLF